MNSTHQREPPRSAASTALSSPHRQKAPRLEQAGHPVTSRAVVVPGSARLEGRHGATARRPSRPPASPARQPPTRGSGAANAPPEFRAESRSWPYRRPRPSTSIAVTRTAHAGSAGNSSRAPGAPDSPGARRAPGAITPGTAAQYAGRRDASRGARSVQHHRLLRHGGEAGDVLVQRPGLGPCSTSACTPCWKCSAITPWR